MSVKMLLLVVITLYNSTSLALLAQEIFFVCSGESRHADQGIWNTVSSYHNLIVKSRSIVSVLYIVNTGHRYILLAWFIHHTHISQIVCTLNALQNFSVVKFIMIP